MEIIEPIIVASDIHGSAYYCEKLMESYHKEGVKTLLLLGDVLYHGPRNDLPKDYSPKACIEMLNSIKDNILCVQGNCDAEVDQMVLKFAINPGYFVIKHKKSGRNFIVTHGHHINIDNMIEHQAGDILLHGHTHVPCLIEQEDYVYINPGSASIPKENSHHGYILITQDEVIWKDFDGNILKRYVL